MSILKFPTASFHVDASFKDFFFDRQRVIDLIGRENVRRLSKMGAYLRQRARTDVLRRRSASSPPGSPPSVHSRNDYATLRNIQFGLDWANNALKVGPVGIPSLFLAPGSSATTVPQLLEFGGTSRIREYSFNSVRWNRGKPPRNLTTSQQRAFTTRTINAHYEPRPFMAVALERERRAGTLGRVFSARVAA
jgi:hypothetical protein